MKRYLLSITLLLVKLLLISTFTFAQFFPESVHAPCTNCVPSGNYSVISGTPSVSSVALQGGQYQWRNQQGAVIQLPSPVSVALGYTTVSPGSSSYGTFLTLLSGPVAKDKVEFIVSGFIPGVQYTMEYAVSSSRTLSSNFGSSATLQIGSVGPVPTLLATSKTDFGSNVNQWLKKFVQFTATTTEISFALSGNTDIGSGFVNFDIWSKPLHCILPKDKQVVLTSTQVNTRFPGPYKTVDLGTTIDAGSMPVGASVVWKLTNSINGANIPITPDGTVVAPGEFYAFYYHAANTCYALESVVSTAEVTVNYVPTQVPLKLGGSTLSIKCPDSTFNLSNKLAYAGDASTVKWFNNNKHLGQPIENAIISQSGTYYPFYYSNSTGAFSVATSTSFVTVNFETPCCKAGKDQVAVQPSSITNTCPSMTADLTTTVANVPLNTQLVWFNNPAHTGNAVSNASAVGAGTYYAFFYDPVLNCYNTDNSTAQVKVTTTLCASNVQLSLKAALQGAISGGALKMKNDLQTYGGTGLLPTSAPYTASSSYPSINNPAGAVGEVVDWVFVEIRSGSSPQTVLQTKSLLLKPNGSIVDRNGLPATFNPQSESVRVVVKHRNHLAIMSNPIPNFSAGSTLNYDFTTALSQASNEFGDPPQMVQKNGIWCLWVGDINSSQDLIIDASDFNDVYEVNKVAPFDVYSIADLNMDGIVDASDYNLEYFNNVIAPYSSLINY